MAIVVIASLLTGTAASVFVTPVLIFLFWRPGYARLARGHGTSGDVASNPDPA